MHVHSRTNKNLEQLSSQYKIIMRTVVENKHCFGILNEMLILHVKRVCHANVKKSGNYVLLSSSLSKTIQLYDDHCLAFTLHNVKLIFHGYIHILTT